MCVVNVKDERDEKELRLLEGQLSSVQELHFAFKRAASRMTEMSTRQYAEMHAQKHLVNSATKQ